MRIILSTVFLATMCVLGFAREKATTPAIPSTTGALTTTALPATESGAVALAPAPADPFLAMRIPVNSKIYVAPFETENASGPVVVEGQGTEEELNALLKGIALASVALKKNEEEMEDLKPRILSFAKKRAEHNANQCTYPPGHPEVCEAYEKQRLYLEEVQGILTTAFDKNVEQAGILKSNFGMLKARIRITTMLLYACDCAGLKPEAATACWSQCFDGANPRLKACLDMSPPLVAACLDKLQRAKDDK